MGKIREGDLFKIIKILDHTFEIKYGYYEEKDKYSKYGEPIPIFPDFIIKEAICIKQSGLASKITPITPIGVEIFFRIKSLSNSFCHITLLTGSFS